MTIAGRSVLVCAPALTDDLDDPGALLKRSSWPLRSCPNLFPSVCRGFDGPQAAAPPPTRSDKGMLMVKKN